MSTVAILAACAVMSSGLTWVILRYAEHARLLDVPNDRSSHRRVTPRGGGLAIVITFYAALGAMYYTASLPPPLAAALLGGLPLAIIGLLDDRSSVPAKIRLLIQLAAAAWAIFWLGGLPVEPLPAVAGMALAGLCLVWLTNLYNFMDGIDGLAGSETAFVAIAAALVLATGPDAPESQLLLGLAGAALGFLAWNWSPARIFMGDVGSAFVGFVFGVFALSGAAKSGGVAWTWMIVLGVFVVDATVTLLRRLVSGQRWYHAHRSHTYQKLTDRWGAHWKVTLAAAAVNLVWLLPMALWSAANPDHAGFAALVALAPLALVAIMAGAGRSA